MSHRQEVLLPTNFTIRLAVEPNKSTYDVVFSEAVHNMVRWELQSFSVKGMSADGVVITAPAQPYIMVDLGEGFKGVNREVITATHALQPSGYYSGNEATTETGLLLPMHAIGQQFTQYEVPSTRTAGGYNRAHMGTESLRTRVTLRGPQGVPVDEGVSEIVLHLTVWTLLDGAEPNRRMMVPSAINSENPQEFAHGGWTIGR